MPEFIQGNDPKAEEKDGKNTAGHQPHLGPDFFVEEERNGKQQNADAAENCRQTAVGNAVVIPGNEFFEDIPKGKIKSIGALVSSSPRGQVKDRGDEQPCRKTDPRKGRERHFQQISDKRPAVLHPVQGEPAVEIIQHAEERNRKGDIIVGQKHQRDADDEQKRLFPLDDGFDAEQDDGKIDHRIQPHQREGIDQVIAHQGIAAGKEQLESAVFVKGPAEIDRKAQPTEGEIQNGQHQNAEGKSLIVKEQRDK